MAKHNAQLLTSTTAIVIAIGVTGLMLFSRLHALFLNLRPHGSAWLQPYLLVLPHHLGVWLNVLLEIGIVYLSIELGRLTTGVERALVLFFVSGIYFGQFEYLFPALPDIPILRTDRNPVSICRVTFTS